MPLSISSLDTVWCDRNLALEHFLECDQRLAATQAHLQELVVDNLQQVVVVLSIQLDEHVILARGEIAFYYLGYGLEAGHYFIKFRGVIQEKADVSTGQIAHRCGINQGDGALDDTHIIQLLEKRLIIMQKKTSDIGLVNWMKLNPMSSRLLREMEHGL